MDFLSFPTLHRTAQFSVLSGTIFSADFAACPLLTILHSPFSILVRELVVFPFPITHTLIISCSVPRTTFDIDINSEKLLVIFEINLFTSYRPSSTSLVGPQPTQW